MVKLLTLLLALPLSMPHAVDNGQDKPNNIIIFVDDMDTRTRALAEVCLVLFNTNEFGYVY